LKTPNFHEINHLPNRTVRIDGHEYLYFSGTAYLGLSQNTAFQQLIREGLEQYGSVYGSSRNGNLQLEVYDKAEAQLADWTGAEAALTLSSGMLAGQAAIRYLMLEGCDFVYAPDVHPAVWHLPDIEPFKTFTPPLEWLIRAPNSTKTCFVTNSVDALRGHLYDLDWIEQIPSQKKITVLIDDSHGIGVTGARYAGAWTRVKFPQNVRLIVTASLAKAMGLAGGVIFSDALTIQNIRHTAYFGGCSPIAPNQLHAYLQAGTLYAHAQEQLRQNIRLFTTYIQDLGLFSYTPDYPVFYTEHNNLYDYLLQNGVFIYSFSYPKPTDKANTRIVISTWHTHNDIEKLGLLIRQWVP